MSGAHRESRRASCLQAKSLGLVVKASPRASDWPSQEERAFQARGSTVGKPTGADGVMHVWETAVPFSQARAYSLM